MDTTLKNSTTPNLYELAKEVRRSARNPDRVPSPPDADLAAGQRLLNTLHQLLDMPPARTARTVDATHSSAIPVAETAGSTLGARAEAMRSAREWRDPIYYANTHVEYRMVVGDDIIRPSDLQHRLAQANSPYKVRDSNIYNAEDRNIGCLSGNLSIKMLKECVVEHVEMLRDAQISGVAHRKSRHAQDPDVVQGREFQEAQTYINRINYALVSMQRGPDVAPHAFSALSPSISVLELPSAVSMSPIEENRNSYASWQPVSISDRRDGADNVRFDLANLLSQCAGSFSVQDGKIHGRQGEYIGKISGRDIIMANTNTKTIDDLVKLLARAGITKVLVSPAERDHSKSIEHYMNQKLECQQPNRGVFGHVPRTWQAAAPASAVPVLPATLGAPVSTNGHRRRALGKS